MVPSYKAASYLSPDTGGSGPLVEAIGPSWLRRASWIGTSLFFLDAVLTIIISSISAADVLMLITPEWAEYRILLAEVFAFFIMVVLVSMGPRRAVTLFLLGGGAFTLFTLGALMYVGLRVGISPELADQTPHIIERLEENDIIHLVESDGRAIGSVLFLQLFLRSMSSAMLGFSGYEMIPASGKHAARPKWKVINTSLTLAAVFLIGTGLMQLAAASVWNIPATEGYSTLLIEYELVFGEGATLLTVAGLLLTIILLLAQGGGYVGGAAVAANAARLGRLPSFFSDDRLGIAVIWGFAALLIPIIREVVIVESYYAFGFVSAFVITSTTIFYVRDDVMKNRGIDPGSEEARSLRFAGLRGMFASYFMMIVLITQKTDALGVIIIFASALTIFQLFIARGRLSGDIDTSIPSVTRGKRPTYTNGIQRAYDEARQRGIVDLVKDLFDQGQLVKFNVEPERIYRLVSYTHNIPLDMWRNHDHDGHGDHEHVDVEPSLELQAIYYKARHAQKDVLDTIEYYSHYGIFTFIEKYHDNWVNERRGKEEVEKVMIGALFPRTETEDIWTQLREYQWEPQPESIWQFCRERYRWAKDQWPNLSDRVTTIWTLQDIGLLQDEDTDKILEVMRRLGRNRNAGETPSTP